MEKGHREKKEETVVDEQLRSATHGNITSHAERTHSIDLERGSL